MLSRLRDLCDSLADSALIIDQVGDDFEHAAVALQALTALVVQRDLRERMARWESTTNERGMRVQRLRPDNPPTPEEAAAGARRLAEMAESRQAPAVRVFQVGSTALTNPDGSEITTHGQYQAALKAKGMAEVTGYDVRNDVGVTSQAQIDAEIKQRIADTVTKAVEFGKQTGQITPDNRVVESAPVIPLPVAAETPRVPEQKDNGPAFEDIPLEKRARVDTSGLERKLTNAARDRAISAALARSGSPI